MEYNFVVENENVVIKINEDTPQKKASRKYYRNNIEHFKEYSKNAYQEKKEQLKEYYREHVKCSTCGKMYNRSNKSKHDVTKFHISHILDL
jgi:hypothetical protein